MSDISIPGVSSKYQTDKLIDAIMNAERVPLNRMEDRKDEFAEQKKAWTTVNQRLSNLADSANSLYGFENPFQNYIADSSDASILTATVDRNAEESLESIKVLQTAKRDVFQSQSLPRDYEVPAGTYGFSLGDREVSFSYKGGDLEDFAEAVQKKGKGLVRARTVRNTPTSNIIVFEGGETGKENTLSFLEDSTSFATDAGILKRNISKERSITPATENVSATEAGAFSIAEGELTVQPRGSATLNISPPVQLDGSLQLRFEVRVENIPEDEYVPPSPPPGPDVPPPDGVELEGIRVENEPSRVDLPEWETPPPPLRIDDLEILSLNGSKPLPAISDSPETQTITLDAEQAGGAIRSIDIENVNTHRRISLSSVEVIDPEARGDFTPVNPGSRAADARLEVNGVVVERPNNEIDDLIPGVVLQPKQESDRTVELSIEPDLESVKNSLYSFIANYNRTLTEINILTSNQESVIEEISYFEEDEKEAAREKLGLFQGETTFMHMKNRLQRIVSAPYETSAGRELSMLSQMGISTNASGFGGGVSRSRLRGYLELDESKLDSVLENRLPEVKELFGRDSDGDLVVDSGLAFEMNQYVRTYTRSGGIIATRLSGLDNRISETDEDIDDFQEQLERKEQDLKRKYGQMESSLGQMEKSQQAIENFNMQNSGQ